MSEFFAGEANFYALRGGLPDLMGDAHEGKGNALGDFFGGNFTKSLFELYHAVGKDVTDVFSQFRSNSCTVESRPVPYEGPTLLNDACGAGVKALGGDAKDAHGIF